KAPISIIPSRPMFTTPLRSEKMPPMAPNRSGVARPKVCAISVASNTASRFPVPDRVATMPSPIPRRPAATAPQPSRRRRRATDLLARVPDVENQDVCAHEKHDQALDDVREVPCKLGLDDVRAEAVRRAEKQAAEEEGAEERSQRGVSAEESDCYAEKADL